MYKCFECDALNKTSVCWNCGGCCEREKTTQQDLSKITGIAQPAISKLLKQIETLSFIPKRIKKMLDALGWKVRIDKNSEVK